MAQVDPALDLWIDDRQGECRVFSGQYLFQQACAGNLVEPAQKRINLLQEISTFLEALWLADAKGLIFMDSIGDKAIGMDVAAMPAFQANIETAVKGDFHMNPVGKSPTSGRPFVLMTCPVKSDGKIICILGMSNVCICA